jgi:hypothetical protein
MQGETWFDGDAGPLVRPYAVTRGRTRSHRRDLDLITLVVAASPNIAVSGDGPEYASILRLCQRPLSVAEIAARLELPLGVAKVLVGDLIDQGFVLHGSGATPNTNILHAVLDGIRKL